MAQAAIPLMAAGALVKTVGGLQAASHNAQVVRAQAQEERQLGVAEVEKIRASARAAMGRQIMGIAESGFQPGTGSARTAIEESLINRELDIMLSRRTTEGRARGLDMQAKQIKRTAVFNAVEGLIGAAGQIAGYRSDYSAAGKAGGYDVGKSSNVVDPRRYGQNPDPMVKY
ncbi:MULTISPECIES: hypothetical protein [Sphingopyxis]|jgi:hypothetical protein|uniref:hypothetical protein n=1 Tax=Sphingopyxis TaxID=165697 RepID=UPI0007370EC4|nr:hypothetical protein [Sphingopyxis sp. H050]KTE19698.1 hypothetical protein ATE67_13720 [Sphingopyxis sp. H050]